MRQSAELFGMMSHRFQIDESQIRETEEREKLL